MAGTKINNFSTVDVNLTAMMTTETALYKGLFKLSLTDFDTAVRPEIAAGSVIDLNGSLYKFDTQTAATVTPADGVVYMKVIPSSSTASVIFTVTAPTWSDSKQGWYESGTSNRYIAKMIKSGTDYSCKILYDKIGIGKLRETVVSILDGNDTTTLIHTLDFTFNVGAVVMLFSETVGVGTITAFSISGNDVIVTMNSSSGNYLSTIKYNVVITAEEI
ncbi:MAG: hypothetical protein PHE51_04955 [Eubacteriales bacterium]|nr:hypothetical protein [Eubacteriales bacterium]